MPLCSRTHFSNRLLQSPIFWLVLWHSNIVQKLRNIRTVHQVLLIDKTKILFLPVVVEGDASTVRDGVIFFQSGFQQLGRGLKQVDSGTRSFSSIWENGCRASSSRITSSSLCSTLKEASSLMSRSSPKTGTGIS